MKLLTVLIFLINDRQPTTEKNVIHSPLLLKNFSDYFNSTPNKTSTSDEFSAIFVYNITSETEVSDKVIVNTTVIPMCPEIPPDLCKFLCLLEYIFNFKFISSSLFRWKNQSSQEASPICGRFGKEILLVETGRSLEPRQL